MKEYACIDFETVDKYISRKLGPGWVYAYNYPEDHDFKVICMAFYDGRTSKVIYDYKQMIEAVQEYNKLIAHNAQYDIGCLYAVCKIIGEDVDWIKEKVIVDTKIMSTLQDNERPNSLSALTDYFVPDAPKDTSFLINAVIDHDLYPYTQTERLLRDRYPGVEIPINPDKALKWAYKNMDVLYEVDPNAMSNYAIRDAESTYKAWLELIKFDIDYKIDFYSDLIHACMQMRIKGVKVDLDRAKEISEELSKRIQTIANKCYAIAGKKFSLNNSNERSEILINRGLAPSMGKSYLEKGVGLKYSVTSEWLKAQDDELCSLLLQYIKYVKIHRDFFIKLLDMQKFTCPTGGRYGRVHPSYNPLGARRTGRFSSEGPNFQQSLSRDPEYAKLYRSCFLPDNDYWVSEDFSSQEPRLQIHYGVVLGYQGADELATILWDDPKYDIYQFIADVADITRSQAKTIMLGLSYGMGKNKLAVELGVSLSEAIAIMDKFNAKFPYIQNLAKTCQKIMEERGYIKTIDGTILRREEGYEYKSMNKLIQGSAAEQMRIALVEAYRQNIPIAATVHDELCVDGTEEDARRVKEIMEKCVNLKVPMNVDYKLCKNWGESK